MILQNQNNHSHKIRHKILLILILLFLESFHYKLILYSLFYHFYIHLESHAHPKKLELNQVHDLIITHLVRRKVDSLCLSKKSAEKAGGNKVRQFYSFIEGIEQSIAKKITADVKSSKIKVQVKINGNELRVDGKKKDDLQAVMKMIEDSKIGIPIQFVNFRD